jgi:hypothetical protein
MSTKEVLSKEFEDLKDDLIKAYDAKKMRASGKWADSLEVIAAENTVKLMGENYSEQLEHGRAPGRFPPIQAIKQWIIDKGIFTQVLQNISVSSLAFLIARKIAQEGWKRQGQGGVELISEVVTDERIQKIIDEVGAVEAVRITSEIIAFMNQNLQVA